jgi:sugar phosphate permease
MDRRRARKNIRSGLIAGALCAIMFGISFLAAAIYVHP